MPEERPRRSSHTAESKKNAPRNASRNGSSGWQLIAVQSISCLVVILVALVFRLIGGSAFSQLRQSFNQSIMSNSVIATLAALLDTPGSGDSSSGGDGPSDGDGSSSAAGPTGEGSSTPSGNATTPTESAASGTGGSAASTASSAAPTGGNDLTVDGKRVFYAPEGASFAPLTLSMKAAKPLAAGTVTSRFGYRENPTKGGLSFHQALDIGADEGAAIAAMYFGVVEEVGENGSYGNYVKIYHGNGIEVLYAHCSEILASKDAVIRAGETVARVGSTGDSTGPHLHIEIRVNGVAYDPAGVVPVSEYA